MQQNAQYSVEYMLCDLLLMIILKVFEWILWLLTKCLVSYFFSVWELKLVALWLGWFFLHVSELKIGCWKLLPPQPSVRLFG